MPDKASPQLEDGHLHLANELVEAMAKLRCPPSVMGALLAVIREVYGYNTKRRTVPIAKVAKHMGVGYDRARQAVAEAVRWNLVTRKGHDLEVQKDYTLWGKPEDGNRQAQYRKAGVRISKEEGRATQYGGTQEEGRGTDFELVAEDGNAEAGLHMKSEGRATARRQRQKDRTPSPANDAGEKQRKAEIEKAQAEAIKQVWNAFGFDGSPSQRTFAKLKKMTKGRTTVLREYADHVRGNGERCPDDEDPEAWVTEQIRETVKCPAGLGWRKHSGPGAPPPDSKEALLLSIPGMPANYAKILRLPEDVVEAIARHPRFAETYPNATFMGPVAESINAARRRYEEERRAQ